ncbi:MAG TPA: penicillin-binding transpeptidase domain-containing protein [Gemmatimonadaceae bacterium]|nr:penicillin-binding transpeptidase domain-containing protein [Gemmatimonadaceae bacterium]
MLRRSRAGLIHLGMVLFGIAVVARAAEVQLREGAEWARRAERQHFGTELMPAPRGTIRDVSGAVLATTRDMVTLAVAPRELRDRGMAGRALRDVGVPTAAVRRALDTSRAWVPLPGTYAPAAAAKAGAVPGVYATPILERAYPARTATRRVVGLVDARGHAIDGIELALDSLLRGRAGRMTVLRDARGHGFDIAPRAEVAPTPGNDVVLTLSQELQEIAEQALETAVETSGASGGDIVVLDPHSGEIRALASQRRGSIASGSPALTEPYEPGSTLKPFMAAALLGLGRATPDDTVNTENGVYDLDGRVIHDVEHFDRLSLRDVIRHSSNIGIVKFSQRLTAREEYETLRDFGFGTPTGVTFPSEASGTLRKPQAWSARSAASLAMGYEIAVTPLQLALAYGALANGGVLLEPALVKEIRSPDGHVLYRHEPRVVRRVVSEDVAATVRGMLLGAVAEGTGEAAALGSFEVAGKTGTAWRTSHGRYTGNSYTASFVGLFPADDPQYVIVVKIDDPEGKYYGGSVAAPVSRTVLQAALAARDAALDRRQLAESSERSAAAGMVATRGNAAHAESPRAEHDAEAAGDVAREADTTSALATGATPDSVPHYIVSLASTTVRAGEAPPARHDEPNAIPDVRGLGVREAVRRLHAAGMRVQLDGMGVVTGTVPAAGSVVRFGSLVQLVADH